VILARLIEFLFQIWKQFSKLLTSKEGRLLFCQNFVDLVNFYVFYLFLPFKFTDNNLHDSMNEKNLASVAYFE